MIYVKNEKYLIKRKVISEVRHIDNNIIHSKENKRS